MTVYVEGRVSFTARDAAEADRVMNEVLAVACRGDRFGSPVHVCGRPVDGSWWMTDVPREDRFVGTSWGAWLRWILRLR